MSCRHFDDEVTCAVCGGKGYAKTGTGFKAWLGGEFVHSEPEVCRDHLQARRRELEGGDECRRYRANEPIEVGDVVAYKGRHYAFDTSIVESVSSPDEFGDVDVQLFRPHAVTSGGIVPGAYLTAERHSVTGKSIRESYVVYTTGPSGNKDNRTVVREPDERREKGS